MFQPDHPRFESMADAFAHVLGYYALKENPHLWERTSSGLLYPRQVPGYLFRGECGEYPTTSHSFSRLRDGRRLSGADVAQAARLVDWIAATLRSDREGLDWPAACAYLQQYGLPTRIVDFTGHLGVAFAFASHGESPVGRLAVVPYISPTDPPVMVELFAHPWAERAQRQAAYGVLLPEELNDLKSSSARSRFKIRWYEFQILPAEKEFFEETYGDLLKESNDPSAGFLRHYINLYVEAFGKLSSELTGWLLEKQDGRSRIPIAPYCYLVDKVEDKEAVVYFRAAESLQEFNERIETERSRRYWSIAHEDHSEERLRDWVPLSPGAIRADPRTYHPDYYFAP
jgi:hypothetical protein